MFRLRPDLRVRSVNVWRSPGLNQPRGPFLRCILLLTSGWFSPKGNRQDIGDPSRNIIATNMIAQSSRRALLHNRHKFAKSTSTSLRWRSFAPEYELIALRNWNINTQSTSWLRSTGVGEVGRDGTQHIERTQRLLGISVTWGAAQKHVIGWLDV